MHLNVLMYCFLTLFLAGLACPLSPHAAVAEPGRDERGGVQSWDTRYAEVRIGRHPDHIRIVFTTSEDNVQKAALTLMTTQAVRDTIKIDFPRPLIILLQDRRGIPPDVPVEIERGVKIVSSGMICRLIVDNLAHVSVTRLSSPPRLAVNAYLNPAAVTPAPKEPSPQVQPAPDQEGRVLTYVIDPGHGGYDKGITAKDFSEKDIALALSKDLVQALSRKGKRAFLTRTGDQGVSLRDRVRIAGAKSPSLTLSIHVSSSRDFSVYTASSSGQSVLRALVPPGSRDENRESSGRYADALSQHLKGIFNAPPKREELPIPLLLNVRGASVVLEVPHPDLFKYDARMKDRIVQAIAGALLSVAAPQRSDIPPAPPAAVPREAPGRSN